MLAVTSKKRTDFIYLIAKPLALTSNPKKITWEVWDSTIPDATSNGNVYTAPTQSKLIVNFGNTYNKFWKANVPYKTQLNVRFERLVQKYSSEPTTKSLKPIIFKAFSDGRVRITNEFRVKDFPIHPKELLETESKPITPSTISNPIMNMIETANKLRPKELILSDVKWKYLVRSVLRGKNLMIIGETGAGKTLAVTSVANAIGRPYFFFNLGATQDPRSSLIGNTHFNKETGTYFTNSVFVNAIQTPNAIILLDELSRAHPEAWNILMTVLDETQRYLRIDESPETPVIKVADGVCFLATANVGTEYTSTRVIDRAMQDRFQILEMDILTKDQQKNLIKMTCPTMDNNTAEALALIYATIRVESQLDNGKITSGISTRVIKQAAQLVMDGFSIQEAAEVSIYPYFDADGGLESERTYVKQIVQKFIPNKTATGTNMFSSDDTVSSRKTKPMAASV